MGSPVTALARHCALVGLGVQKEKGAGKGLDCFRHTLSPLTDHLPFDRSPRRPAAW